MNIKTEVMVRPAQSGEWRSAMELAWQTFLRFDARDYSNEGIDNFREFVTDETLYKNFCEGRYPLFVAYIEEKLVGMLSLRNLNHISLLFVDSDYHKKGVGSVLIEYAQTFLKEELNLSKMTVFAAPYAVGFYKKVNFVQIADETERDGIRFTPMECNF